MPGLLDLSKQAMAQAQNTGPQWEPEPLDGILNLLDLVSRPGNAVRAAIVEAEKSGLGGNVLGAAGEGLSGQRLVDPTELPGMSNLPDNTLLQAGPVHLTPKTLAGFAAGTALDPLTYATAGLGKALQAVPKAARLARPAMIASEAAQSGIGGLGGAALVGRDGESGEWDPGKAAGGFAAGLAASQAPGLAAKGLKSAPAQMFLRDELGSVGKFKKGSPEDIAEQARRKALYEASKKKPASQARPSYDRQQYQSLMDQREQIFQRREAAVDAAEARGRDPSEPIEFNDPDALHEQRYGTGGLAEEDLQGLYRSERTGDPDDFIDTEDLFAEPAPPREPGLVGDVARMPIEQVRAETGGPPALRLHAQPGAQELAEKQYRALMDQMADLVGNPRTEWGPDNPALQPKLSVPKGTPTLADEAVPDRPPPPPPPTPEPVAPDDLPPMTMTEEAYEGLPDDFVVELSDLENPGQIRADVTNLDVPEDLPSDIDTGPYVPRPPRPRTAADSRITELPGSERFGTIKEGLAAERRTRKESQTFRNTEEPPPPREPVKGNIAEARRLLAQKQYESGISPRTVATQSDTGEWELPKGHELPLGQEDNPAILTRFKTETPGEFSRTGEVDTQFAPAIDDETALDWDALKQVEEEIGLPRRGRLPATGMEGERYARMVKADSERFARDELARATTQTGEPLPGNPLGSASMRTWLTNRLYGPEPLRGEGGEIIPKLDDQGNIMYHPKTGDPVPKVLFDPLWKRVERAHKKWLARSQRGPGYNVKQGGALPAFVGQPGWQNSPEGRQWLAREAIAIATHPKTGQEAYKGMTAREFAAALVQGNAEKVANKAHYENPEGGAAGKGRRSKAPPNAAATEAQYEGAALNPDEVLAARPLAISDTAINPEDLEASLIEPGDPYHDKPRMRDVDTTSDDPFSDRGSELDFASDQDQRKYYRLLDDRDRDEKLIESYTEKLASKRIGVSQQELDNEVAEAYSRLDKAEKEIAGIRERAGAGGEDEASALDSAGKEGLFDRRPVIRRRPGRTLPPGVTGTTYGSEQHGPWPGETGRRPPARGEPGQRRPPVQTHTGQMPSPGVQTLRESPTPEGMLVPEGQVWDAYQTAADEIREYARRGEHPPRELIERLLEFGPEGNYAEAAQGVNIDPRNKEQQQRKTLLTGGGTMSKADRAAAARTLREPTARVSDKPRPAEEGVDYTSPKVSKVTVEGKKADEARTARGGTERGTRTGGASVAQDTAYFQRQMAEIQNILSRTRSGERIWPDMPEHGTWVKYMQGRLQRMLEGAA